MLSRAEHKPLTEVQQQLVRAHLPLVQRIYTRYYRKYSQYVGSDDLISAGTEGLIQAALRYHPQQTASFATYAGYRIKGAIFDFLRVALPGKRHSAVEETQELRREERCNAYLAERSEEQPRSFEEEAQVLEDMVADVATIVMFSLDDIDEPVSEAANAEELVQTKDRHRELRRAIKLLPKEEATFIDLYYVQDISMSEYAERFGCTISYVSRMHNRAIQSLSVLLGEIGK